MTSLTTDFIFNVASLRCKIRKEHFHLSNEDISYYIDDEGNEKFLNVSYISRILNNQYMPYKNRRSPNPFLIPKSYIEPLQKNLNFNCTKHIFFGENWEIEMLSPLIFQAMILDLMNNKKTTEFIETLLLDSVSYAQYVSFFELFESELNKKGYSIQTLKNMWKDKYMLEPDKFEIKYNRFMQEINYILAIWKKADIDFQKYFIFEPSHFHIFDFSPSTSSKRNISRQADDQILIIKRRQFILQCRINELYNEMSESFIANIKKFFHPLKSFKDLPRKIENFLNEIFIPELNQYINKEGGKERFILQSLGHRARQIIKNDIIPIQKEKYLHELSKLDLYVDERKLSSSELRQKQTLLDISLAYVEQLEKYQTGVKQVNKRPPTLKEWNSKYLDKLRNK